MLILHSEDDLRCPINQAEELFVALAPAGQGARVRPVSRRDARVVTFGGPAITGRPNRADPRLVQRAPGRSGSEPLNSVRSPLVVVDGPPVGLGRASGSPRPFHRGRALSLSDWRTVVDQALSGDRRSDRREMIRDTSSERSRPLARSDTSSPTLTGVAGFAEVPFTSNVPGSACFGRRRSGAVDANRPEPLIDSCPIRARSGHVRPSLSRCPCWISAGVSARSTLAVESAKKPEYLRRDRLGVGEHPEVARARDLYERRVGILEAASLARVGGESTSCSKDEHQARHLESRPTIGAAGVE